MYVTRKPSRDVASVGEEGRDVASSVYIYSRAVEHIRHLKELLLVVETSKSAAICKHIAEV
jgi:hypothetical protein